MCNVARAASNSSGAFDRSTMKVAKKTANTSMSPNMKTHAPCRPEPAGRSVRAALSTWLSRRGDQLLSAVCCAPMDRSITYVVVNIQTTTTQPGSDSVATHRLK